jgi:plasmid maintenance system antidote protein VapI
MRVTHVDNQLLDFLRRELDLNTDRELAQLLELGFPTISKIRHGFNVTDMVILRIHERTDIPVRVIRDQLE